MVLHKHLKDLIYAVHPSIHPSFHPVSSWSVSMLGNQTFVVDVRCSNWKWCISKETFGKGNLVSHLSEGLGLPENLRLHHLSIDALVHPRGSFRLSVVWRRGQRSEVSTALNRTAARVSVPAVTFLAVGQFLQWWVVIRPVSSCCFWPPLFFFFWPISSETKQLRSQLAGG